MRRSVIVMLVVLAVLAVISQCVQASTWVGGSQTVDVVGVYDSAGLDNMPGARYLATTWTDSEGNLWLFGGTGMIEVDDGNDIYDDDGRLNDLWKFNGQVWTWVSGSNSLDQIGVYGDGTADPCNVLGGRDGAISWIDDSDNLWLFGGLGRGAADSVGYLNDLWKFDGTSWTWVSGSNLKDAPAVYGDKGTAHVDNVPCGRSYGVSWIDDSGNLWMFGGETGGNGYLNDVWKYDVTAQVWTWMAGTNQPNSPGVYDDEDASKNIPGGRRDCVGWKDSSGNFWLYGGAGIDSAGSEGFLGDLWKFDGVNWIHVSGSNLGLVPGNYGEKKVIAETNMPNPRFGAVGWIDENDKLWLFGGYTYAYGGLSGMLNDLWVFDGDGWIWMDGANSANRTGIYGIQDQYDIDYTPGSRRGCMAWTVGNNKFWLFGGVGYGVTAMPGLLNDMWEIVPTVTPCRSPIGDLDGDCVVNLVDLAMMCEHWLEDNR